uniref:Uncharacterized protein n=1 Tax=Anguilla anguilla TaxID=7936 RepID=A0A0E9RE29_ANGAN
MSNSRELIEGNTQTEKASVNHVLRKWESYSEPVHINIF